MTHSNDAVISIVTHLDGACAPSTPERHAPRPPLPTGARPSECHLN